MLFLLLVIFLLVSNPKRHYRTMKDFANAFPAPRFQILKGIIGRN